MTGQTLTREDVEQIAKGNQRIVKFLENLEEISERFDPRRLSAGASGDDAVNFTDIPPWVNEVMISFSSLGSPDASNPLVQVGGQDVWYTDGYFCSSSLLTASAVSTISSTFGFVINNPSASFNNMGTMWLRKVKSNSGNVRWVSSHFSRAGDNRVSVGGGRILITEEITKVRVINSLGTAFDDGFIGFSMRV